MDSTLTIGIFTLAITLIIDIINRIKSIKDNEPQLSFELRNYGGFLYLIIKNTGNTKATNIKINILKVHNNANQNLIDDFIFSIPFELSSNEKTQGIVATFGESMASHVFPFLDIEIFYKKAHFIKKVYYKRQVFFNPEQGDSSLPRIQNEINLLSKEIDKLRNPVLRLANYFDGYSVAPFDSLNLLPSSSFQNDLVDVLKKQKSKIHSREESIQKRLR